MRLIKYDNYQPDAWAADVERFFERALSDLGRWNAPGFSGPEKSFRVDIYQDDANHYLVAELPGVDKKDVGVELENAVLTITASRREGKGENVSEFKYNRSITVDDSIDREKVKARLENGILTVTLPKAEARKPRAIEVG